jgi:glycosyltransferase involved in cell wall biosynthesis
MIVVHRILRTWLKTVSVFIVISEFEKQMFIRNGFPASKIAVKPNFVLDPGPPEPGGDEFLFVGRLVPEKGIRTLLRAMEAVPDDVRLRIVGDGPLETEVRAAATVNPRITYVGRLPQREVLDLMAAAKCVILPSEWYETFGRVAAEAFARSTPVIAARIGAVAEIVDHGHTGLHFTPGDAADLAQTIAWAHANRDRVMAMRPAARREFEQKYTAERNCDLLMDIYNRAISENPSRGRS